MKNRDMVYGSYQSGGFAEPNMVVTPPSGYNINTQYQAFGPGVAGNQVPMMQNPNVMQGQMPLYNGYNNGYSDEYEQRLTRLERQIRSLDQRIRALETGSGSSNIEDNTITDSNLYMI